MRYDRVIWDFNGTLLSDMQVGIDATNIMLEKRGLPLIRGMEHYRELFRFPIREYYADIFDLESEDFDQLAPEWFNMYTEMSKSCRLCDGVRETLEKIWQMGIPQTVLSASEMDLLEGQLQKYDIRRYFDGVIGQDNINADGKTELALKWRAEHPNERLLFVGDTGHDAEVARAMGAECVLFCGGHQSRRILEKCADIIIDNIPQIIAIISDVSYNSTPSDKFD